MFACIFLPLPASAPASIAGGLEAVARGCSPRVEVHKPGLVTLDARGLDRLLGTPREIGVELQRGCAARDLPASVAVAGTRTAAMLLAVTAPGLAVAAPGEERRRLSPLPLGCLPRMLPPDGAEGVFGRRQDLEAMLALLARWGLRTLGDLARLPEAPLAARLGQAGARWQRVARGEDLEPLVSIPPEAPIEETLDLDWPVEGLEPLSFVLARVLDPIAQRLEQRDEAAVVLTMTFRLASRETATRQIELPAPMRDPKVLRTLVLLHLESHPLESGVDRVTIRVEPARAPVTQFSLLSRALPFPEQIATLVARLTALAGERRVGAPALVDSHRPGAFAMQPFRLRAPRFGGRARTPVLLDHQAGTPGAPDGVAAPPPGASLAIRRFRLPIVAQVMVKEGRPVRVTTERRGLRGGVVQQAAGPWRTSGEWWLGDACHGERKTENGEGGRRQAEGGTNGERKPETGERGTEGGLPRRSSPDDPRERRRVVRGQRPVASGQCVTQPWDRDEWDVALADGALYRVFQDRMTERWFVEGIVD